MLLSIEENPYLRKNNNEKNSNCWSEFKKFETY